MRDEKAGPHIHTTAMAQDLAGTVGIGALTQQQSSELGAPELTPEQLRYAARGVLIACAGPKLEGRCVARGGAASELAQSASPSCRRGGADLGAG